MPIPQCRSSVFSSRQLAGGRPIFESNAIIGDQLWVTDEAYEMPEKETDFQSLRTGDMPLKRDAQTHLRINTFSRADLHDRYMSDEEEPSPSPDSDAESDKEGLKPRISEKMIDTAIESITADEYEAEIAIAVAIIAMRPKLVDINKLAPMHKRKRAEKMVLSHSANKNAAHRMPKSLVALEATKVATPEERLATCKDSLRSPAPESWLPSSGVQIVQEEDTADEHYFPDLELRKAPTYHDYDPYSLSPPCLSPRNSYNTTSKKPGSVARARYNSHSPITINSGWRGLTRSMSLAKRPTMPRRDNQPSKKPKMIARAANERQEPLTIPAFPFGDA